MPARITISTFLRGDLQQCTDNDDAADGVGHAHQRGVQGRSDIPDHHVADKTGKHENGEMRHELGRGRGAKSQQSQGPEDEGDNQAGNARFFGRGRLGCGRFGRAARLEPLAWAEAAAK